MSKQGALENIKFVKDWFLTRQTSKVDLTEVECLSKDAGYESNILKEIRFKPQNPTELQAEFWFADDGLIGFGIERQQRVAKLVGIKLQSLRFAGGKEPSPMSNETLRTLLTLVADGKISISMLHIPIVGLVSTRLIVGENERHMLEASGFTGVDKYFTTRVNPIAKLLKFDRWT